jgi:hypothetical protein
MKKKCNERKKRYVMITRFYHLMLRKEEDCRIEDCSAGCVHKGSDIIQTRCSAFGGNLIRYGTFCFFNSTRLLWPCYTHNYIFLPFFLPFHLNELEKRYNTTAAADVFVEIAKNYSGKCAPLKKLDSPNREE